jgi:ribulose-bisphosphate carboxylase large chain
MAYLNASYQPSAEDVLCSYHVEPASGRSQHEAIEELCKKASVDLVGGKLIAHLTACAYWLNEHAVKVAYPAELFEAGNIPHLLTIVAGKIFGLEKIAHLRLQDVHFPEWWLKTFRGPVHGSAIVEKIFEQPARPLVSSLISPEVGLDLETYLQKAEASFMGGCDVVRDSPQIRNASPNDFERRVEAMLALAEKCAQKSGLPKMYFANLSGPGDLVLSRAEFVLKKGGRGAVVNFVASGLGVLQMVRNRFPELVIYGDRTSHAATARNKRQGISMTTLGKLARLAGADLVEIGSITGDMVETEAHVVQLHANLLAEVFKTRDPNRFDQHWHGLGNSLPVTSGGLTAEDIRELRQRFGNQLVLQFGRSMTGTQNVSQSHVEKFLDELGPLVPLV